MRIMKKAVLTKEYRALVDSQPHDMCTVGIHPTKEFLVTSRLSYGAYTVKYYSRNSRSNGTMGYLERKMFTYLSSKAKKRTGKRKRKLKQRKGTPRKGRK